MTQAETVDQIFYRHSQAAAVPHVIFRVWCDSCDADQEIATVPVGGMTINLECATCGDNCGTAGQFLGIVSPGYHYLCQEGRDLITPQTRITRYVAGGYRQAVAEAEARANV